MKHNGDTPSSTEVDEKTANALLTNAAGERPPLVTDEMLSSAIDASSVQMIMRSTTKNLNDNNSISQVLPELSSIIKILKGMILSPKDMSKVVLNVVTRDGYNGDVPKGLIDYITNHLESKFSLEEKLPSILEESYITHGAKITMAIPSGMLDRIIAQESFLGNESFKSNADHLFETSDTFRASDRHVSDILSPLGISGLTDNLNTFRIPRIADIEEEESNITARATLEVETYAMLQEMGGEDIASELGNLSYQRDKAILTLPRRVKDDMPVGEGIIVDIPMDVCLPIHKTNNPKEHTGYFILLDSSSNIVSNASVTNYTKSLAARIKEISSDGSNSSNGISLIGDTGEYINTSNIKPDAIAEMYERTVVNELNTALSKSSRSQGIQVADSSETYQVLFSRYLRNMKTRLIYVPAEYISYIAFNYNSLGIGVSLIEKNAMMSGMMANLNIANITSHIDNSLTTTTMTVKLSEKDKVPQQTIAVVKNEIVRSLFDGLPLYSQNPAEIIEAHRRASVRVNVEDHPLYPNVQTEIDDNTRSRSTMDSELMDYVYKGWVAGFTLPADVVDGSLAGDFAINQVTSNEQVAKEGMQKQGEYIPQIANLIRLILSSSEKSMDKILSAFDGNAELARAFINALTISLPAADTAQMDSMATQLSTIKGYYEDVVDSHVSEDMLNDIFEGEYVAATSADLRELLVMWLTRRWLSKSNAVSEMDWLYDKEKVKDVLSDIKSQYHSVIDILSEVKSDVIKYEARKSSGIIKALASAEEIVEKAESGVEEEEETTNPEDNDVSDGEGLNDGDNDDTSDDAVGDGNGNGDSDDGSGSDGIEPDEPEPEE